MEHQRTATGFILLTREIHMLRPTEIVHLVIHGDTGPISSATVVDVSRGKEFNLQRLTDTVWTWSLTADRVHVAGEVPIEIFVDGISLGRDVLRIVSKMEALSTILNDVTDPLQFIMQTLQLQDIGQLEEELFDIFNTHYGDLKLLFGDLDCFNDTQVIQSSKEFPTILHLFAKLGLQKVCTRMSEMPGFRIAMRMKNRETFTPAEMAEQMGHIKLVEELTRLMDEPEEEFHELPSPVTKVAPPVPQWEHHPLKDKRACRGSESFSGLYSGHRSQLSTPSNVERTAGIAASFATDSESNVYRSGSGEGTRGHRHFHNDQNVTLTHWVSQIEIVVERYLYLKQHYLHYQYPVDDTSFRQKKVTYVCVERQRF